MKIDLNKKKRFSLLYDILYDVYTGCIDTLPKHVITETFNILNFTLRITN